MENKLKQQNYQTEKRWTRALQVVFIVSSVGLIIYQLLQHNYMHVLRCLLFPLFLLIPPFFRWIKLETPWRLCILLYLFSIFAFSYGCVYGAFGDDLVIDKVSHFLSGFVITIFGICLYYMLARPKSLDDRPWVAATYALFFSMFVAVLWECIEFFDFTVLGNDSQNHLTTGVFDTMYDLMSALIASLLSAAAYILWRKKGLKLLTAWVAEEFYDVNVARRQPPQN